MKRVYVFVISLLCIALIGCTKKPQVYAELTSEMPDLHSSVICYLEAVDHGMVKGERFQAKFLSLVKVCPDNKDDAMTYYRYQVALAPVTEKPVQITKILFHYASDQLMEYYQDYQYADRWGIYDEACQIGAVSSEVYGKWEKRDELLANEFFFTINNMGNARQKEVGISEETFDIGARELRIIISCDGKEETLLLPYQGDVLCVRTEEDLKQLQRRDITELFTEGTTGSHLFVCSEAMRSSVLQ